MDLGSTQPPPDQTVDEGEATIEPPAVSLGPGFRGRRFGDYVAIEELSRGGQGVVLLAEHVRLAKRVALKLLLGPSERHLRRFSQEARVLAQLEHPNIASAEQFDPSHDPPYMAMRHVQGKSLKTIVEREGVPELRWSVHVLKAIAGALEYCHSKGIVHRDVKPANIMIEEATGLPVLVDFGLVSRDRIKLAMRTLDGDAQLTKEGEILGTPSFMAPEQVDDSFGMVGPPTDVYGLAATLYYLLTGTPPYTGATGYNAIVKVMRDAPPDPRDVNADTPGHLAESCLRAMAKSPLDRPSLTGLFSESPPSSTPASTPLRARPFSRLAAWASVTALGIAGLGIPHARSRAARASLTSAEALQPTGSTYLQRGHACFSAREWSEAIANYDRAIELGEAHSIVYVNRGAAKSELGNSQGAVEDCARALEIDPLNKWALAQRGGRRAKQGDNLGAHADFSRALEVDPRDIASLVQRGVVKHKLGDPQGALKDFDAAIELGFREPLMYRNRGQCNVSLKDWRGAVAEFGVAILLDPGDSETHVNRGLAYAHLGNHRRAIADYDRALELDPLCTEAYVKRGVARTWRKEFKKAIADLDRALELAPKNHEAYRSRGVCKDSLGVYVAAIEDYEQALVLMPADHPRRRHVEGYLAEARRKLSDSQRD